MLVQSSSCPKCGAPIYTDMAKLLEQNSKNEEDGFIPHHFGGNSLVTYTCQCRFNNDVIKNPT
jgi:hypothetical protein